MVDSRKLFIFGTEAYSSFSKKTKKEVMRRRDGLAGNERGYIFTANPGSSSISAYKLKVGNGSLVLLAGAAGMENRPLDLPITMNGGFLYALDPANGGIDMFHLEPDGSLTNLGTVAGGLSIFAQGIGVR